jgi:molybdenum cofactor cytidylyltransferase
MFVVVGQNADDVLTALYERKFRYYRFGQPVGDMFRSVQVGLGIGAVNCADAGAVPAQILLHLADHPEVRGDTLETLIRESAGHPAQAVMPAYRSRGGHPVLIPPAVVPLICSYSGRGGLRKFWLDHPELCVRLPVDDPGVVFDIDTQSDYDLRIQ